MADPLSPLAGIWKDKAAEIAISYGVPKEIMWATIQKESGWNIAAMSPANSNGTYDYGIMQLNSKYYPNAAGLSVEEQMALGAKALAANYKSTGTWFDASRAYNRGLTGAQSDPNAGKDYATDVLNTARALGFDASFSSTEKEPSSFLGDFAGLILDTFKNMALGAVTGTGPAGGKAVEGAAETGKQVVENSAPDIFSKAKQWLSDNALSATLIIVAGGIAIFAIYNTFSNETVVVNK